MTTQKKGRPTPPSTANPLKRMKFFVEHQNDPMFPGAREEAIRMAAVMGASARSNRKRRPATVAASEAVKEAKPVQDRKASFLEKTMGKIKKHLGK